MIEYFAEIGSNFITKDGKSMQRAIELIDKAKQVGCAGVKFQYFKAEKLWHPNMKEELEAARERELPIEWAKALSVNARKKGLLFGLSVFDIESVNGLVDYVDYFKIASFEAGWLDLVREAYKTNKRLMISLGQSDKKEIMEIIQNLPPQNNQIDILHCTSNYPTQIKDCNLEIIKYNQFINGWSDHSRHPAVLYAAVGSGAKLIEFHLDLDDREGLEDSHSWSNTHILVATMINIEAMEEAMGTSDWDKIIKLQDRKYKVNPITGLRGA